jgi:hypothetical protein
MAVLISFILEAPVDKITGFFFLAIHLIKGKFVISADAILKKGTNLFKKFTESVSKGVDKKSILFFLQNKAKVL